METVPGLLEGWPQVGGGDVHGKSIDCGAQGLGIHSGSALVFLCFSIFPSVKCVHKTLGLLILPYWRYICPGSSFPPRLREICVSIPDIGWI